MCVLFRRDLSCHRYGSDGRSASPRALARQFFRRFVSCVRYTIGCEVGAFGIRIIKSKNLTDAFPQMKQAAVHKTSAGLWPDCCTSTVWLSHKGSKRRSTKPSAGLWPDCCRLHCVAAPQGKLAVVGKTSAGLWPDCCASTVWCSAVLYSLLLLLCGGGERRISYICSEKETNI